MPSLRLLPLALAFAAAPLAAQHRASWGDELPAPMPVQFAASRPDTARWPAPPALAVPSPVRALYVNAWAFGTSRFGRLLDLVAGTEVNSLVIDVKDDTGYLTYRSEVPTAIQIGANTQLRARDTRVRVEEMRQRGIHPIARIVVAKDPLLALRKPQWAIRTGAAASGTTDAGHAWVDAFQDSVWIYAAQLAEEAVRDGIRRDPVRLRSLPRRAALAPGHRGLRRRRARRASRCATAWRTASASCGSGRRRSASRTRSTSSASPPAPRATWASARSGRIS